MASARYSRFLHPSQLASHDLDMAEKVMISVIQNFQLIHLYRVSREICLLTKVHRQEEMIIYPCDMWIRGSRENKLVKISSWARGDDHISM